MDQIQKKLWDTEQEILDEIHRICTENGLRYSLAYGTLLGAVRHQSFIPWDDDIDVMMPREDYEKLVAIWETVAPCGFLLETDRNTDDCVNNFAKIRKDHTIFLQFDDERKRKHHKGIFVDVFPFDRCAENKTARRIQYGFFALNLLFNRGYSSSSGGLTGALEKALLTLVPKSAYRKLSLRAGERSRAWNDKNLENWVSPCTISDCRRYYPADLFEEFTMLEFHGKRYYAVKKFDEFLTICYGDYMKLPPEEERVWKHKPILVDFEHNYEELVEFQGEKL